MVKTSKRNSRRRTKVKRGGASLEQFTRHEKALADVALKLEEMDNKVAAILHLVALIPRAADIEKLLDTPPQKRDLEA
jgi:hypothetical protein